MAEALRHRGFAGHLAAGGHFASIHAERLLEDVPALDTIVHGDGEEPMVDLAASLEQPERVAGLVYRGADGRARPTGPRPSPDDLDSRPWPKRPRRLQSYLGLPIANLLASRGCYASCAFCSIRAFHERSGGRRFRQRRPEAVAEEMAALYHDRGVRIFNVQDDNFFVPSSARNLERFAALRRALEARAVGRIAIQAKGRPDCIHEQDIRLLREMGLFRLFVGIETNAVAGLATLGRGMDLSHNQRALDVLRRQSIHTCFNLLMFDPESTLETVRTNVDFMRRQDWFPLNFCRTEVYGGTPLEARLGAEGRLLGTCLGYSYRIADPRAQRAYELFRSLFWPRNFAFDGTHFGSMKLDYNLHLLAHFFPRQASPELWRRAKGLVHELNRHSASLMDRILALAGSDTAEDRSAGDALLRALELERRAVDASLSRRMDETVRLIESLGARGPGRRRFLQAAMGAAAAAALATTGPGCRHTHMCEAPPPPPDDHTHMCEAPPPPEPVPALEGAALEAVREQLQSLADRLTEPGPDEVLVGGASFELGLTLGPDGQVSQRWLVDGSELARRMMQTREGADFLQEVRSARLEVPELDPTFAQYQATVPLVWRVHAPPGETPELLRPVGEVQEVEDEPTHMRESPPPPEHRMRRRRDQRRR